jgi:ABC-type sugar transport system ATPase subunit
VRAELKDVQRTLHLTTLYVTHDQEEALSLSDSIAVMSEGRIVQVGASRDLYNEPTSRFSADFTGVANFIIMEGKCYLVRPEWISVGAGNMSATVAGAEFLGRVMRLRLMLAPDAPASSAEPLLADVSPAMRLAIGERVAITLNQRWEIEETAPSQVT